MNNSNRVHLVVNPLSARGKTAIHWELIRDTMRLHFREFKYIFTEKPRQATQIVRELLKDGFDLIIGVGGDGTLNEIANGFFHNGRGETINSDASLGIIPSGTGSDFVRCLKIPRDFSKSIQKIKNSIATPIDIGKITYLSPDAPEPRYFVNVADFGLGAEVVRRMSATPLNKRSKWVYYSGLLSTLKKYRSPRVCIKTDTGEKFESRFLIGAVANGSVFGGGMIIAPHARPDDGLFDLVLIDDMSRLSIVRRSLSLYTGMIHKHPVTRILRARSIEVHSIDDPVHIEHDGESGGTLPVRFECLPAALNIRM